MRHVGRCFMGSAEDIEAHHQLVEDAVVIGARAERARLLIALRHHLETRQKHDVEEVDVAFAMGIESCIEVLT